MQVYNPSPHKPIVVNTYIRQDSDVEQVSHQPRYILVEAAPSGSEYQEIRQLPAGKICVSRVRKYISLYSTTESFTHLNILLFINMCMSYVILNCV